MMSTTSTTTESTEPEVEETEDVSPIGDTEQDEGGRDLPPSSKLDVSGTEEAPEAPDDDGKGGKEAAKYRRRLRETEAERDALAQRVETLQRAEVERLAGHLSKPSAIWAGGVQLADVLDARGDVDPDRVSAAVSAAAEALGLARAPRTPRSDPSQGGGLGRRVAPSLADAFSPRH